MSFEPDSVIRIGVVLAAALGMSLGSASARPAPSGVVRNGDVPGAAIPAKVTDRIIIRLRADAAGRMSVAQQRAAIEAAAARAGTPLVYRRDHGGGVHTLRLTERLSAAEVEALAARIAAQPGVAYAEPDWVMRHTATPNDALYPAQWHYMAADPGTYGVDMPAAWDIEKGDPGIVIAVIDTGYRPHADLAGRILPGYDFVDYDYIDYWMAPLSANDGDGRDPDAQDPGDWITWRENDSGFFAGCGESNSSWHGTHVAGTIGAVSDNGFGVAGVNWYSKILPVRVLGKCGGYLSDIVDGMRWAAGLEVPGIPENMYPAHVLNLSLGGGGACRPDSLYQRAINEIVAAGKVVVVAAGNENMDAALSSPASCNGVIAVAATGRTGNKAFYSNYGSVVNIAAPGGDRNVDSTIFSTWNAGTRGPGPDAYTGYQGTSMAAPHVAGIASLLLSIDPTSTPCDVNALLRATVTAFPSGGSCTTQTCGPGIVNAGAAVSAAQRLRDARAVAARASPSRSQLTLPYSVLAPAVYSRYCMTY